MGKEELQKVLDELFKPTIFSAYVDTWVDCETGEENLAVYVNIPVKDLDSQENIDLYHKYDEEVMELVADVYMRWTTPIATHYWFAA